VNDIEDKCDGTFIGSSASSHSIPPPASWTENAIYDEHPPTFIYYSIEWKLTVNNRGVSKDTEPNVAIALSPFWNTVLRPKLEKLVRQKLPVNKSFRAEDTNVTVSLTGRSERDLVKRFDELDIDWTVFRGQADLVIVEI
jgi:hypothetical protein